MCFATLCALLFFLSVALCVVNFEPPLALSPPSHTPRDVCFVFIQWLCSIFSIFIASKLLLHRLYTASEEKYVANVIFLHAMYNISMAIYANTIYSCRFLPNRTDFETLDDQVKSNDTITQDVCWFWIAAYLMLIKYPPSTMVSVLNFVYLPIHIPPNQINHCDFRFTHPILLSDINPIWPFYDCILIEC